MDDAAQTVKGNGESAHGLIQKVKRATRRRFGAEEKIRILLEGMKREVSTSELCRKEGIHPHAYYSWLKDFMEAGKSRLRGDLKRSATEGEVESLRRENERLKVILADPVLENTLLKKSLIGSEIDGLTR
ncbi:MAG: transposase [Nitrospirae bacterium]|nr:transposase [Nitrospirota bacterium]